MKRHSQPIHACLAAAASLLAATALLVAPSPAGAASYGLNAPPTARITAPAGQVYVGDTVTFSGAESSDPDGQVAGYAWSASGASVTGSAASKTAAVSFTQAGTAKITLTVTDNGVLNGLLNPILGPQLTETGTTTKDVKVIVRPNRAPVFTTFRGPNSAPTAYFVGNNIGFTDPDGDDVDIVTISCSGCRGTASIFNNSSGAGVPNAEQREGFVVNTPCFQQNIGVNVTIDDRHGHQATINRTITIYNGGFRGNCP